MFTGAGRQIITVICGFIFTRFLLVTYGSAVNGLISSITQFLGFISFLEMGIGPVIQSNLYKPLAENNFEDISKIIKSSRKFFQTIAYIFLFYIGILCLVFPKFVNTEFSSLYIISLILIISISTFAQYYFGIPYQLLITADQKNYIQVTVTTITLVVNTFLCIFLMKLGFGIQVVKLVTAGIYLLRPLFFTIYVKKHYDLNTKIVYSEEPIKQKWNGFAQHLCAVVTNGTDVIILTFLSTLENISVYTVYHTVIFGVTNLMLSFASGLSSFWGNMIAKKENNKLRESFSFIEWGFHTAITFLFILTGLLIIPFIQIYTKDIKDVNYIQPFFSVILVLSFAFRCIRIPYFDMVSAAGHYKQTQIGAIIAMFLNLLISISFVFLFGLVGVALGTLVAFLFHTVYFAVYLSNSILNRPIYHFFGHLVVDFFEVFICVIFWHFFSWNVSNYFEWLLLAIVIALFCFCVILIFNILIYKNEMKLLLRKIKK